MKEQRNNLIKKFRKTETLKQVGERFNLTPERIRQITQITQRRKYCSKHKHQFIKECSYCKIEKRYKYILRQCYKEGILDDIRRLSKYDRTKGIVIERRLLVKLLKEKYKLSPFQIGKLLERDHTSIVNLL